MPILQLLGSNHHLPLLHMSKRFICIEETKERINEFEIGCMINPDFHGNKSIREQVDKSMNDMSVAITQPFIKNTFSKNNTSVLTLLMLHETRIMNPKKCFRALSCVIYTILNNYFCIDYLSC